MRRALVLTNEAARHPFRQHLLIEETLIAMPRTVEAEQSAYAFFGISFVAFFVLFLGMII
jgi:hypothetical protein